MTAVINWDAVSAIATVVGIPLAALGLWASIRKSRATLENVNRRVTTPNTVTGTIGEEVAKLANTSVAHDELDDKRFKALWAELGKDEPG